MNELTYKTVVLESPVISMEAKSLLLERESTLDTESKQRFMQAILIVEEYILGILRQTA